MCGMLKTTGSTEPKSQAGERTLPSRKEFEAVKRALKANGWAHICSVMSGDKGDPNYGSLFTKTGANGKQEFWLNKDTIGSHACQRAVGLLAESGEQSTPQFTHQQIQNWRAYERVRAGGRYNMFDPRARVAAGLDGAEYSYVMKNYSALKLEAEEKKEAK